MHKTKNILFLFLSIFFIFLAFPNIWTKIPNFIFGFILFIPIFFYIINRIFIFNDFRLFVYKDCWIKNFYFRNIVNFKFLFEIFIFSFLANFALVYLIIPTFMMAGLNFFLAFVCCSLLSFYLSIYWTIFLYIFYIFQKKFKIKFDLNFILFLSSLWVILEFFRTYIFTGFPWNLLGYSQWQNLFFIQISDITGIYGISFFVIFINLYIFYILDFLTENFYKTQKKAISYNNLIFVLILLFIFGYGLFSKNKVLNRDFSYSQKKIKISLLQGNIDQYKKFDNNFRDFICNSYSNLMNLDRNTDVFILPETAYPFRYYSDFNNNDENIFNLAYFFDKKNNITYDNKYILGVFNQKKENFYNSAIYLDKNLNFQDEYHKIHLVPFGEYLPLKNLLIQILPFLNNFGGVTRGNSENCFDIDGFKFGVNICFESLFPDLIRKFVYKKDRDGADILVNISNDGWYMKTSAPYQHFVFNIFRAVENRRYLIS